MYKYFMFLYCTSFLFQIAKMFLLLLHWLRATIRIPNRLWIRLSEFHTARPMMVGATWFFIVVHVTVKFYYLNNHLQSLSSPVWMFSLWLLSAFRYFEHTFVMFLLCRTPSNISSSTGYRWKRILFTWLSFGRRRWGGCSSRMPWQRRWGLVFFSVVLWRNSRVVLIMRHVTHPCSQFIFYLFLSKLMCVWVNVLFALWCFVKMSF